MNVVSEAFEEKLGDKMSEIKYRALDNNELKNKISEAEITVDKISRDHEEASNLVAQLRKESTKKVNAIKKIKTKKEDLEKSVSDMENLNSELLTKMKSSESKRLELEATTSRNLHKLRSN